MSRFGCGWAAVGYHVAAIQAGIPQFSDLTLLAVRRRESMGNPAMGENYETNKLAGESLRGRRSWPRWVAVIVVLALVALGAWKLIGLHHHLRNKMRAHGCYDNLRRIGLVCKMWENENNGRWPRLSDVPGEFMFDPGEVSEFDTQLGELIPDFPTLRCPRASGPSPSGEFPGDAYYIYLGPGPETEEEALAFLDTYVQAARAGDPLPAPDYDPPTDTLERARADWTMPVAFDRPKNHNHEGINVLFASGNVEWREMGTRYPATKAFWDKLAEVEAQIDRNGGHVGEPASTVQTANK